MATMHLINIFLLISSVAFGSFIANAAVRWGQNPSVWQGRSHCPTCQTQLRIPDLVPILSYLWRRGRCRYCNQPISPLYTQIEISAFIIAFIGFITVPASLYPLTWVLGLMLLLLASIDIRLGLLPDSLTLPLILGGLAFNAIVSNWDTAVLRDISIGVIAGYLSFYMIGFVYEKIRKRAGLGLGDAKLFAASGAWLGWQALPAVMFASAAVGLVSVMVMLLGGAKLTHKSAIAFGPALSFGFWVVWLLATSVRFA